MFYFAAILLSLLAILWFIRTTKAILFWLHLWQLKEYHIGRFLDHFQTSHGKSLIWNKILGAKILFFISFFIFPVFALIALFVTYFLEAIKGILDFFLKRIKKPILTKKTVLLITSGVAAEALGLWFPLEFSRDLETFAFRLLIFDIFTPVIVSGIVFSFHPLVVFARNQTIKKAAKKRAQFKDLLVIGITGSYGKTSTKEFLYTILAEKFGENRVLKTKEHQNSEVGISQCILNDLKPEHKIFICEMGAYNRGGIKLLCDIVKPKIGILTGINEQHMATFGSQENIIKTKYELIESLPKDGIAFFNAKNEYCVELYEKTPNQSLRHGTGQAHLKKILYGQEAKFPGEENILGAMAVAKELGMAEEEIAKAVEKIENRFGGIQLKKGINGLNIIDATYSANPDGVIAHLEYLKSFSGQKVIVMPCLIELGRASKEIHRRIGKKIAEVCDLAMITTKDRFKEIKEEAGDKALFMEEPKKIFEKIKRFCKEEDTVLLESRVPKELIDLLK